MMTVTTQQARQNRHEDDWMDALCYAIIERVIRNRGDGDDDDSKHAAGASRVTTDPQD